MSETARISKTYSDSDSMKALYESIQLINDPNVKTFKTMEALIADLENDELGF